MRVVNGAANFADFWIQPNYAVNLQNMNGSILGLSSDPKSRAKVEFEGKVDKLRAGEDRRRDQPAVGGAVHRPQGELQRRGDDLGDAVLRPLRGLQDREGQAVHRRGLSRREPHAARQAELRHRPAGARRARRKRGCRAAAAQAGGGAAEGPQRRHRHRSAHDAAASTIRNSAWDRSSGRRSWGSSPRSPPRRSRCSAACSAVARR